MMLCIGIDRNMNTVKNISNVKKGALEAPFYLNFDVKLE